MGLTHSKSSIDIVNDSIISIMLEAAQNCTQYTDNVQTIQSGGLGLFGTYTQTSKISLTCLQNLQIDNNLISKMADEIISNTQQTNTPLLPSIVNGDVKTNIKNVLTTKINQSFIQNCAANIKNVQTQIYNGIQVGIVATQDVDVVVSCISNALNNNGVAQSIVTDTSQSQNQTSKSPLSFITDILSTFSWMIYIVIFVIVGIVLYVMFGNTLK